MARLIAAFVRANPYRSAAVLTWLLLAGLAEGFGIMAVLPMLNLIIGDRTAEPSSLELIFRGAFEYADISLSAGPILAFIVASVVIKNIFILIALKEVGYAASEYGKEQRTRLVRAMMTARWRFFIDSSRAKRAIITQCCS